MDGFLGAGVHAFGRAVVAAPVLRNDRAYLQAAATKAPTAAQQQAKYEAALRLRRASKSKK